MAKDPISFESVTTVERISEALLNTNHRGFPILNIKN